jgi:hypothetical protein
MAETKNVFISHVHKDDHGLQKLKDLLAPKGMDVCDSSIHVGKFNNASDPMSFHNQQRGTGGLSYGLGACPPPFRH